MTEPEDLNRQIDRAFTQGSEEATRLVMSYQIGVAAQAMQMVAERSFNNSILQTRCQTIRTKLAQMLAEVKNDIANT